MLILCVVAQAATIAITWSLWQTRQSPPHLPLIGLPQIPFGIILLCSLVLILFRARLGVWIHVGLLAVSCLFDSWRVQPQVIGVAVLMIATVEAWGPAIAKSYLIAMWFWSGLHKLLSPDWLGQASWDLLQSLPVDAKAWHGTFGYGVAIGEILLAVVAIVRPRWAAPACVVLHSTIALFLSPWVHNWNVSVIPWNLCTAVVGYWVLSAAPTFAAQSRAEWAVAALLLVMPAGFYLGWVDHSLAHVLYSDNVPYALITRNDGVQPLARWGDFRVPFPHTQRAFHQYFSIIGEPGWKLHVADPRAWVQDSYYLKQTDGTVVEIDHERFHSGGTGEVAGVEVDNPRSVFALSQGGARMLKRTADSMIYAVEITPPDYEAGLLQHLRGLPSLEQLQLAGCEVTDKDLKLLTGCDGLRGIGLNRTSVTDAGIKNLAAILPRLRYMELEDTATTEDTKNIFGQDTKD